MPRLSESVIRQSQIRDQGGAIGKSWHQPEFIGFTARQLHAVGGPVVPAALQAGAEDACPAQGTHRGQHGGRGCRADAAAKAQIEYDRKVAEAQRKAQEIIAQAAQASDKVGADIKAEAQREADAIRQKARDEAEQERSHILAEVQSQIASLSMAATERVLGQGLNPNMQRKLIDGFLAELGGAKP